MLRRSHSRSSEPQICDREKERKKAAARSGCAAPILVHGPRSSFSRAEDLEQQEPPTHRAALRETFPRALLR
jgi:hypothetical protein